MPSISQLLKFNFGLCSFKTRCLTEQKTEYPCHLVQRTVPRGDFTF